MSDAYHTDIRKQLLARGYHIIPNIGKVPAITGWNEQRYVERELERDGALKRVGRWEQRFPEATSTGVRIEDGLVAADYDTDHEQFSARFWPAAEALVPALKLAPARYGGGDFKVALFLQLDGEPFGRVASRRYLRLGCFEFFGGLPGRQGRCSRQFGILGPHSFNPDGSIAREYVWGGVSLADVGVGELPGISRQQASALVDLYDQTAAAMGFAPEESPVTAAAAAVYDITAATRFHTNRGGEGLTYEELCDAHATYGDHRCTSSFMVGRVGEDRERAWVFWSPRHDCVAVYVYGDEQTHYPVELEPARLPEGFAADVRAALATAPDGVGGCFDRRVAPDDFYAFMPTHEYIYTPLGALWPAASINAIFAPIGGAKASTWLDNNRAVQQMTWVPGEPAEINDRLFSEGGWVAQPGTRIFNTYRPPQAPRVAGDVGPWRAHLARIYPAEAAHIELWMAHRVQRPHEKINHALALGGGQGIGKDTLLEPLKYAVGAWNFQEVGPQEIMDRFTGYLRAVVLRVSEARDLGSEFNRYTFYNHMKKITAAPPDTLRVNEKHRGEYYIPNVVGAIITFNELDSMFLPPDDRRHYVAWSEATKEDFAEGYWLTLWDWYDSGGLAAVAHHLATLDLSAFDAKRPPPRTEGFRSIVNLMRMPEDADLADALDRLARPDAVTVGDVMTVCGDTLHELGKYLADVVRNARKIPYRFKECGYSATHNPDADSGLWRMAGRRQVIYVRDDIPPKQRLVAALARQQRSGTVVPLR